MIIWRVLGLLITIIVVPMQQVRAEPAGQSDPGTMRRIGSACRTEVARFCPALSPTVPRPRDEYICLKPYKASLSFNCRSVVSAIGAR